jgi:hypothetical protein
MGKYRTGGTQQREQGFRYPFSPALSARKIPSLQTVRRLSGRVQKQSYFYGEASGISPEIPTNQKKGDIRVQVKGATFNLGEF